MTRIVDAQEQKKCDEFNDRYPVGTLVRYWRGVKEDAPSGEGPTRYPATVLSGHTAVIWVYGCRGCVALSHIEVVASEEAS